jgi:hypothetical protein
MIFNKHSKTIEGFSNYNIDTEGRIFNRNGKELKQTVNRDGYSMVKLCNNGYEKNCSVHRLVAEAFIPNPHNKETINHKDGVKTNNSISNLEWSTYGENEKHAYATKLRKSYLTNNDRIKGARISGQQSSKAVEVLETGEIYPSVRDCAEHLNCDPGAISKCCNGQLNKHHGYHFNFCSLEEDQYAI